MISNSPLKLDHIAISARTLEEGAAYVRNHLGVDVPAGGQHAAMGTHNLLMALGSDIFLEVIAVNPDAAPIDRPRWFNLDNFDGPPRIGTWVLNSPDLIASFKTFPISLGSAVPITRGSLSWLMAVTNTGKMPFEGMFPTLMQWPDGPHPASQMTDLGCRLVGLTITHPKAIEIQALLDGHVDMMDIHFNQNDDFSIRAEIQTPTGVKVIS